MIYTTASHQGAIELSRHPSLFTVCGFNVIWSSRNLKLRTGSDVSSVCVCVCVCALLYRYLCEDILASAHCGWRPGLGLESGLDIQFWSLSLWGVATECIMQISVLTKI